MWSTGSHGRWPTKLHNWRGMFFPQLWSGPCAGAGVKGGEALTGRRALFPRPSPRGDYLLCSPSSISAQHFPPALGAGSVSTFTANSDTVLLPSLASLTMVPDSTNHLVLLPPLSCSRREGWLRKWLKRSPRTLGVPTAPSLLPWLPQHLPRHFLQIYWGFTDIRPGAFV